MQNGSALHVSPATAIESDLYVQCQHCGVPLVVDRAAAGMTLTCQRCGKPTPVPPAHKTPNEEVDPLKDVPEKLAELQRRLTENESQRTEITGYINQLSIQLHRWQLRLQMLNDRKRDLTNELATLPVTDQSRQS